MLSPPKYERPPKALRATKHLTNPTWEVDQCFPDFEGEVSFDRF